MEKKIFEKVRKPITTGPCRTQGGRKLCIIIALLYCFPKGKFLVLLEKQPLIRHYSPVLLYIRQEKHVLYIVRAWLIYKRRPHVENELMSACKNSNFI